MLPGALVARRINGTRQRSSVPQWGTGRPIFPNIRRGRSFFWFVALGGKNCLVYFPPHKMSLAGKGEGNKKSRKDKPPMESFGGIFVALMYINHYEYLWQLSCSRALSAGVEAFNSQCYLIGKGGGEEALTECVLEQGFRRPSEPLHYWGLLHLSSRVWPTVSHPHR